MFSAVLAILLIASSQTAAGNTGNGSVIGYVVQYGDDDVGIMVATTNQTGDITVDYDETTIIIEEYEMTNMVYENDTHVFNFTVPITVDVVMVTLGTTNDTFIITLTVTNTNENINENRNINDVNVTLGTIVSEWLWLLILLGIVAIVAMVAIGIGVLSNDAKAAAREARHVQEFH